jgi:hypothetical protein
MYPYPSLTMNSKYSLPFFKNFRFSFFLFFSLFLNSFVFSQSYLGITSSQVNLRSGPGTEHSILKSLNPNTQIFVVSATPVGDFYNVVDIQTNKEGYVHKSYVVLKEKLKANEDGLFTPTGKTDQYESELSVTNNTSLTLTLKLNEITYSFSPGETKKLSVSPGTYEYRASAPGVIPDFGSERIQSSTSYTWSFYIVTR